MDYERDKPWVPVNRVQDCNMSPVATEGTNPWSVGYADVYWKGQTGAVTGHRCASYKATADEFVVDWQSSADPHSGAPGQQA